MDILSAGIATRDESLRFFVEVLDIDAPAYVPGDTKWWSSHGRFDLEAGSAIIFYQFDAFLTDGRLTGELAIRQSGMSPTRTPTTVSIDAGGNEVAWTISLADFSAAVAGSCPTCSAMGTGSTIKDAWVGTSMQHEVVLDGPIYGGPGYTYSHDDFAFAERDHVIDHD